jgi:hypothetical protein
MAGVQGGHGAELLLAGSVPDVLREGVSRPVRALLLVVDAADGGPVVLGCAVGAVFGGNGGLAHRHAAQQDYLEFAVLKLLYLQN